MVKQKYTILQNKIPINLLKDGLSPEATVNKIVRVAGACVKLGLSLNLDIHLTLHDTKGL